MKAFWVNEITTIGIYGKPNEGKIIMDDHELNKEILENLTKYVLIKGSSEGHLLFSIKNQSYIIVEDIGEFNELLILKGIRIVDDVKEVRNPEYVHYVQVWNDETKEWMMIPQKVMPEYLKKNKK